MKYAGIGSRETPQEIGFTMYGVAQSLAQRGHILRSGHADGADTYFENGCNSIAPIQKEIFTAAHVGENSPWLVHAELFHPAWNRCSPFAKKLHARNSAIVCGPFLNDAVKFIVCWTKDGKASGGTGQALRIAKAYGIPIFNLYNSDDLPRLSAIL